MTNVQAPMTNEAISHLPPPSFYRARRGLTLVEVLVALTASLVLLGAVVSVLGMVSGSISDSRAIIEMSGRLRSASLLLRSDLQNATCDGLVWQRPEDNKGYIEIKEGTERDATLAVLNNQRSLAGDCDDYIYFTVQAKDKPFVGRWGNQTIQSNYAEIAWWANASTNTNISSTTDLSGVTTDSTNFGPSTGRNMFTLNRRVFLIMPRTQNGTLLQHIRDSSNGTGTDTASNSPIVSKQGDAWYDLSFRRLENAGTSKILNTLGDLTYRKYRLYRTNVTLASTFPHYPSGGPSRFGGARVGEELVLSNVLAFDIKVFDPNAIVDANGLLPTDPGYNSTSGTQRGAYVDLGSFPSDLSSNSTVNQVNGFRDRRHTNARFPNSISTYHVFDTWSTMYESDGIDQDADGLVDEGTDGLDNDSPGSPGYGIVDDAGERETCPPYPFPLRGIQITIRVWEPSSGTIRQVTVEESFMK
jgi:type II secretory pathway component PulJ